ncbi:hypothetical protein JK636_04225 [Clostridium sp. YIM B02515]|uniref:Uncharacterized protein n=1 Tax=Clostridium rhizosphaerae TaxID=2803861 RepID=A0ABS1T6J0_9CLOT|nr:hypothetical protein [Clostridium rhizosphaerae]MBL4934963.1 hypothetical protein [Clostridium rhizosphaerae]
MVDRPLDNNGQDSTIEEDSLNTIADIFAGGYADNLTAKLGGNYSKIIEFYEDKL